MLCALRHFACRGFLGDCRLSASTWPSRAGGLVRTFPSTARSVFALAGLVPLGAVTSRWPFLSMSRFPSALGMSRQRVISLEWFGFRASVL